MKLMLKSKIISAILIICFCFGFVGVRTVKYLTRDKSSMMVVLAYHRIVKSEIKQKYYKKNQWVNDLGKFEQQMQYLYDNNYTTLSLDEYYDWYLGKKDYNTKKTCLITIDDGDIENYYNVIPVLKKYNFKATVFIVGSTIKESVVWDEANPEQEFLTQELLERISIEYPNLEIQNHSYNLHHKTKNGKSAIYSASNEMVKNDFEQMKKYNMKYMAYPYGHSTKAYKEMAKQYGYRLAFSFAGPYIPSSRKDDPYEIRRVKINGQIGMWQFKQFLKV